MIPIITYHALGSSSSPVFTPVAEFEAHLQALSEAGYRTVSMSATINWLKGGPEPAAKSVVISFDDGYLSVYTEAWPRLKALGFSAIVFPVTGYCGRDNRWPGQHHGVPERPLMTWSQISDLAAEGCEFGSHTHTHRPLPIMTPGQAVDEIVASKELLLENTGTEPRIFAFPYGATNSAMDEIVRQHFDSAVSTNLGVVQCGVDLYNLARIDSFYLNQALIPHLQQPFFHRYLRLRQGLRHVRRGFRTDWQLETISLAGND